MAVVLHHPDASIRIEPSHGKHGIVVEPRDGLFTPVRSWATHYPVELIEHVLRVKGPAYLCDEICRDEHPLYVEHCFTWDLLGYVPAEGFRGTRVLDFGSGSGASSMVLARMFPETEIVGVELAAEHVELARHRAAYYGVADRVRFHLSPDPDHLPAGVGLFDHIVFSAVYEHLLPHERRTVLPLLWSHLRPGGILFLDQTPHRWFPIEMHTTGLPLINYLPDSWASYCARRFSSRVPSDASWPELLRKGIRGATIGEILTILRREDGGATLLKPRKAEARDHFDVWYGMASGIPKSRVKTLMLRGLKAMKDMTGVTVIPALSLAIKKSPS
jgi:2-polyprenyl-3-methyl-5-hydroxy-6-metoxy-1,4-benzoquinol methylase